MMDVTAVVVNMVVIVVSKLRFVLLVISLEADSRG